LAQGQPPSSPARTVVSRASPRAPWALNADHLAELADEWSDAYRSATPFPHVVIDGALPDELLDDVAAEFPPADDTRWLCEDSPKQLKQQWRDPSLLPPVIASTVALLQSAPFLSFLERLTGVPGLMGDPHCFHGGPHQIWDGGYLKVHVDEPRHPTLWLQRRVNVILYLTREWSPDWGGELELWDRDMTECGARLEPRFNRLVVFDSIGANHGHPTPATLPPGLARRSLALYYYVSPANPSALPAWAVSPEIVQARPGMNDMERWRVAARDLVPPVLARAIRRSLHRKSLPPPTGTRGEPLDDRAR